MTDGVVLFAVERDLGPANERPEATFSDLNMFVGPEGRKRTEAEYAALFAATGFRFAGTVPTASGTNVFEGVAAQSRPGAGIREARRNPRYPASTGRQTRHGR